MEVNGKNPTSSSGGECGLCSSRESLELGARIWQRRRGGGLRIVLKGGITEIVDEISMLAAYLVFWLMWPVTG